MKMIVSQIILADREISDFICAALSKQNVIKMKSGVIPNPFNALNYPYNCIATLNHSQEVIVCDYMPNGRDDFMYNSDYAPDWPGKINWDETKKEFQMTMLRDYIEYKLRVLITLDIDSDDFETYKLQQTYYDVFVKQEFIFEKCWPLLQYILWDEVRFPVED